MKRGTPLKRTARMKARNHKRVAKRQKMAFGDKALWVRTLPCAVKASLHAGNTEAAHTISRGAGGTSEHIIPLCNRHHREQHDIGIRSFAAKYDIDLDAIAAGLEKLWQAMNTALAA